MQDTTGKVIVGLLLLVGLWIGVYWLWPAPGLPGQAHGRARRDAGQEVTRPAPTEPVALSREAAGASSPPITLGLAGPGTTLVRGVIAPEFYEHTVLEGETFATISKKYFGSAGFERAVSASNPLVSPLNLRAGRVIRVPKDPANIQGVPAVQHVVLGNEGELGARGQSTHELLPSRAVLVQEYEVRKGDSLSKIAQAVYGEQKHARVIFEANKDRIKTPDALRVGQKLRIPPKEDAVRVSKAEGARAGQSAGR